MWDFQWGKSHKSIRKALIRRPSLAYFYKVREQVCLHSPKTEAKHRESTKEGLYDVVLFTQYFF